MTTQELVETYRTPYDTQHEKTGYKTKQYQKGLEMARDCYVVYIARNGVWSSDNRDGSTTFSYEGIGYHACTADLLQGWLDGGVTIVDYRSEDHALIPNPLPQEER